MSLDLGVALALALAPALFWFPFFARRDARPEPAGLLLRTFAWGALALVPSALLESSLGALAFLLAGPIEELAKYAAASSAARHRSFDEPSDGLVYAAAAALGFATLENLLYVLHGGPGSILVRGPVTTLGHVLFSAPWGYAMAVKRFRGGRGVLRRGLLVGAGLHVAFNLLLAGGGARGLEWLLIPFGGLLPLMWLLAGRYYARVGPDCAPAKGRLEPARPLRP